MLTPDKAADWLANVAAHPITAEAPSLGPYEVLKTLAIPGGATSPEAHFKPGQRFMFDGDEPVDIWGLVASGSIKQVPPKVTFGDA